MRRGNTTAFEVLVSRYHARLLAFCRHLLGSREDAEDVLQEVLSAAFNAILDDDRQINVRPWLYRIARNRSLNHLRRIQAVGVDSMDIHLSEHGATTADKVHEREEFRMLVGDIHSLPETQRTALVLREMDALSYEQIAEAMETTVPSVKSLLVRARVSLAEAAEARLLTCEQVRMELGEVAEGLQRRPGALVRRHLRTCDRCSTFKSQLNETSKALTVVLPVGGFVLLRKLALLHLGHSAGAGAGAGSSASGASAAGQAAAVGGTAAAGATAVMGTSTTGFLSASIGAIATKAAAGLAAAALVTAGAVEVEQPTRHVPHHHAAVTAGPTASVPSPQTVASAVTETPAVHTKIDHRLAAATHEHKPPATKTAATTAHKQPAKSTAKTTAKMTPKHGATADAKALKTTKDKPTPTVVAGHTQTETQTTVLSSSTTTNKTSGTSATDCLATGTTGSTTAAGSSSTTSTSPSTDTGTATSTTTTSTSADPGTTTTATTPSSTASGADSSCAADSTGSSSGTGTSAGTGTSSGTGTSAGTGTSSGTGSSTGAGTSSTTGSSTDSSSGAASAGSALTAPSGGTAP